MGRFTVRCGVDHTEFTKALEVNLDSRPASITWVRNPEGWETLTLLVDGLIEAKTPAHQYLTEEGLDDAVVELSFREG